MCVLSVVTDLVTMRRLLPVGLGDRGRGQWRWTTFDIVMVLLSVLVFMSIRPTTLGQRINSVAVSMTACSVPGVRDACGSVDLVV